MISAVVRPLALPGDRALAPPLTLGRSLPVGVLAWTAAVLGGGLGLASLVWRATRSPSVASRGAALFEGPLRQLLVAGIAAGLLAAGAAVAKLTSLPLGVAGVAVLGPALFGYVHLGVLAAAHGYRELGVDFAGEEAGRDADAGATSARWLLGFSAWTAYVVEAYPALPVAAMALFVVALPSAIVIAGPVAGEAGFAAGAALAVEALALSVATGYRRRLPDGPSERVREALEAES
ncbi:MAG: hypothetical protein ABEJ42_03175 [Halobacteriaceae archaeon]